MKLGKTSDESPITQAEVKPEPALSAGSTDFGNDKTPEKEMSIDKKPDNSMPFQKEPFDAGVDADEENDPKKFIEQLSGKLGQSLRQYTKNQGQPDFELEKFAINSVISATNTAEMDEEDRNDIIKKIEKSGDENGDKTNSQDDYFTEPSNEEPTQEAFNIYEADDLFLDEPKKNNMFQPNSNDILDEMKPCWSGYKQVGMKEKNGKKVPNCVPVDEESEGLWANIHAKRQRGESPLKPSDDEYPDEKQWKKLTKEDDSTSNNYMFWQNIKTIHHATGELLNMNQEEIDALIANGHGWAVDHVSTSSDDIEEVYHFIEGVLEENNNYYGGTESGYEDEYGSVERMVAEGKYDGKPLGKPMKGDVKKFKVYVKNDKGNVIKVNFGDPNMEIKRDDPEKRKSFRARHKCSQAKDRTTPKYWSCKMWSNKPVSKIVETELTDGQKKISEGLNKSKKISIFDKNVIKMRLQETFKQEEPLVLPVEPKTKPKVSPLVQPSRRNKPFLPQRETQPNPKAKK